MSFVTTDINAQLQDLLTKDWEAHLDANHLDRTYNLYLRARFDGLRFDQADKREVLFKEVQSAFLKTHVMRESFMGLEAKVARLEEEIERLETEIEELIPFKQHYDLEFRLRHGGENENDRNNSNSSD